MVKELKAIEAQLGEITMQLQQEFVHTGDFGEYLLNVGSPAGDFLVHATESERAFILHKLAPQLEVANANNNHVILKLN